MDVWLPNAFALLWFILAAVAVGRSFNFWVAASAFLWLVLAAYVLRPLDRVSRA
jgi:membrane protein implicated in regulation of membrane protease activity